MESKWRRWSRWRWLQGQSPPRQDAGTGPSDPRNLVSMVAARQNFSWKMINDFRVFVSGGINSPKYDGQRRPWAPHHFPARPEVGPRHQVVWMLVAPLLLPFGLCVHVGKIGGWVFVPCNSENISCVGFLKRKTEENRKLTLGISC